jgi:hypothetical protein
MGCRWWKDAEEETATDRRKREHLKRVRQNLGGGIQEPCMHDGCQECCGTGIKLNGEACFHNIACPCPKCSPRCSTIGTGTLCCT